MNNYYENNVAKFVTTRVLWILLWTWIVLDDLKNCSKLFIWNNYDLPFHYLYTVISKHFNDGIISTERYQLFIRAIFYHKNYMFNYPTQRNEYNILNCFKNNGYYFYLDCTQSLFWLRKYFHSMNSKMTFLKTSTNSKKKILGYILKHK